MYLGADPVTGRQRYATKTVRVGKRDAQRMLNDMVVEAERCLTARTTATVDELLDRWLELARTDLSPKTTREVSGYIERNLRPALGDVKLNKLTAASLDRYYCSLLVDGGRRGRPLAQGTIRRIHGILRRVRGVVVASEPRVVIRDVTGSACQSSIRHPHEPVAS